MRLILEIWRQLSFFSRSWQPFLHWRNYWWNPRHGQHWQKQPLPERRIHQFECQRKYYQILNYHRYVSNEHNDGLVQHCSISIASALEILQACTKPLICINTSLFLWFQLTISQHWFRGGVCAKGAKRHYLDQCWARSVTPYSVTTDSWRNNYVIIYFQFNFI